MMECCIVRFTAMVVSTIANVCARLQQCTCVPVKLISNIPDLQLSITCPQFYDKSGYLKILYVKYAKDGKNGAIQVHPNLKGFTYKIKDNESSLVMFQPTLGILVTPQFIIGMT